MNAIANFYDSASGRITDPQMFMLADADLKRQVIALWTNDNARHASTFADKIDAFFSDAQVGYAFLTPQLHRIEAEVYMAEYPSFDIMRFMDVDSSGDMWDVGTLVLSMDQVGNAEFLAAGAFDMPYASTKMAQATRNFHLAGIGYEWNTQEMQRAAKMGRALSSDKALAAGMAADRFIYGIAMTGKTPGGVSEKGWTGFVNNGSSPSAQVAANGTGSSRLWTSKTPDQILADINEAITAVETGTGETHVANTLVLPTSVYNYIATTPRSTGSDMTILSYLKANNTAGESLTILKSRALETAGTGGTTRLIAYDRNRQVLKFHLPGPHTFLQPFQKSSMVYEVAGIMNVGGFEARLPKAIVYRDSF
ncbi:DUF2184 domain-containing protein [Novosphingobium sp. FSY-8]|uniref:DUF2184 domain-containing protein n=1 Tax=Novosphingobium ovatum TaxID=1908523 RepID=A0ABW9XFP2_9SPHN|nr:DUF2184 domain-containing protein [Novosphingobium ovatum]NBC37356.1 DUF2184 domain-containing protein [Novosphingobium ovatum]